MRKTAGESGESRERGKMEGDGKFAFGRSKDPLGVWSGLSLPVQRARSQARAVS